MVLEELAGRGPLVEEQAAELAELQRWAGSNSGHSGQQDAEAETAKQTRRPGIEKDELNEWVERAKNEGKAETAAAGLKWLKGQGAGVNNEVWGKAWLAADGKEKQVRRPGVDKERLKEWVERAKNEGGVTSAAAGLKWVREKGIGVGKNVWGDAWLAATGKEKQVRRSGVDKERLNEWVVRAKNEGGAETAAAGLQWVHGQGIEVNKNVWGDAWLAAAGKEKRVRRPQLDKERLNEWVVRAKHEGGAETAAAGLQWVRGQRFAVNTEAWLDAWRDAAGKEKQVQRPQLDKERLNEWVGRAKNEGGAKSAAAGLQWVHGQGFGVDKNVWADAWESCA